MSRLKSLPNRSETVSVDKPCLELSDLCCDFVTVTESVLSVALPVPLALPLPDAFHRELSILNEARTDFVRRNTGDGGESAERLCELEMSFSLFMCIAFNATQ